MNDDLLVGLDEYKVMNEENPIAYTRDINCCVGCIIHREKSSVLMHIEAYDNSIELYNFTEILKSNQEDKIQYVELFMGPNTNEGNISILSFMLAKCKIKYSIHKVFKSLSNEYGIGYNYNTKDHYMISMDCGKPILRKRVLK